MSIKAYRFIRDYIWAYKYAYKNQDIILDAIAATMAGIVIMSILLVF